MNVSLAAVTHALRSLSQLITYFFFFHQKQFGSGTVGDEGQCLGQPWNVIVYQIKNVEVRICRFKLYFFKFCDCLLGTRSLILLGRPLKKMRSSRIKR